MHLHHGAAPMCSKRSNEPDPNSSPCARQTPLSQTMFGNSTHHSSRLSPSQYVHLPSGLSPDLSNSQSPSPTQHLFSPCPQYRSTPQHPYLLHQPAAQYPSPGVAMRAGARHIRRAPSVEAESPVELQVSLQMSAIQLVFLHSKCWCEASVSLPGRPLLSSIDVKCANAVKQTKPAIVCAIVDIATILILCGNRICMP